MSYLGTDPNVASTPLSIVQGGTETLQLMQTY